MDGIHDLGGKSGYGRVIREPDEPVFHAHWEAEVFAIMRACGLAGIYRNADQFRHAIERVDPEAYLSHGYYGRWLGGMENLLVESGTLKEAEINARTAQLGGNPEDPIAARPSPHPDRVNYDPEAFPMRRKLDRMPAFSLGARVLTQREAVPNHTRLPAYARGKPGRIIVCHGGWVFPDSNAHGHGEDPQYLYTVAFSAKDLWLQEAEAGVDIHLDLFEPYLSALE